MLSLAAARLLDAMEVRSILEVELVATGTPAWLAKAFDDADEICRARAGALIGGPVTDMNAEQRRALFRRPQEFEILGRPYR